MKFTFILTQQQIDDQYKKVLDQSATTLTLKGFRPGKAPLSKVEEHLTKSKLEQKAIESLLPQAYNQALKQQQLKPVSFPKINLKTREKNNDWVFEAEVAERPEVNLNNYQKTIKGLFAKETIWTPKQGNPSDKQPELTEEQRITQLFDYLLKTCSLTVPDMLIEQETNRALSKLLDQVNKLGLTVDDYLASTNKNSQTIKEEYQKSAETNLKLEFILQSISEDLQIKVSNEEINSFIDSIGDDKTKQSLRTPEQKINLELTLVRRKTVEKLLELAR